MSLPAQASRLFLGRLVPTVMYDSVTIPAIPERSRAVAGYVDGRWPTYTELEGKHKHVVSIAVFAKDDAHCLDIETGDATISEAAGWYRRQIVKNPVGFRPILYTQLSRAQALVDEMTAAGITRGRYRLWTAHYTGHAHRCSHRCGLGFTGRADATQWTDRAHGLNLDESLLSVFFFHRHR